MYQAYHPRRLVSLGVKTIASTQLKVYGIVWNDEPLAGSRFDGAWSLAEHVLPGTDESCGRPGLGFAIEHQGRTGDYFILCWWDRENELPIRVWVRDGDGWRAAANGESVCVWDLRVLWWEREAYVATMLAGRSDGRESYLKMTAAGFA